jgi:hypothetical protein
MNIWCRIPFWSRSIRTIILSLGYHARTSLIFVTAIKEIVFYFCSGTQNTYDNLLETAYCYLLHHSSSHVSAQPFWYIVYLEVICLQILTEENVAKQTQASAFSVLEISHLASFLHVLTNSSGMSEFLLLCFVLSIVPLYWHFFDGPIFYTLVIALKISSVFLPNIVIPFIWHLYLASIFESCFHCYIVYSQFCFVRHLFAVISFYYFINSIIRFKFV